MTNEYILTLAFYLLLQLASFVYISEVNEEHRKEMEDHLVLIFH